VVVADTNGCVNSASLFVLYDGIQESSGTALLLYPNPAGETLTVEMGSGTTITEWRITDLSGKLLLSSDEETVVPAAKILVAALPKGVYLLMAETAKGSFAAKWQKN
jgi:hypothetical protein